MVGDSDQGEHDRHFREDAYGGGQGGGAGGTEEGYSHRHRKFKEIGGADHAGRGGDGEGKLQHMGSSIGQEEDKEGLNG